MALGHHARSFARIVLGLTATAALALGAFATSAFAGTQDLVISQVYSGGGNSGAPLTNDFIELHNRGTSTVSLAGMSVQYAPAASATWQVTALSGSILPGAYYLVQEASGGAAGVALPASDATGTSNMAVAGGKVAIVTSTTPLGTATPLPASYVDLLGYGSATYFEGTVLGALSNTTAALRANSGCQDNDVNSTDFSIVAPAPRNSATTVFNCRFTVNLSAGAGGSISPSTPQTVIRGDNLPFTVTASTGYHITSVLDGVSELGTSGSYSLINVTADHTISATFAINQYTLTYNAGPNGSIVGTTPQTVNHGADGALVTATPATGYHFDSWSDGYPTAARTDLGVTGNITVTATFAINQYTLTYLAGANGSIVGTTPQTVNHGADGALVTATPAVGYHFDSWSDGYPTAARTDLGVTGNITVTAAFAINQYTLTYLAGANGSIVGTTPQTVNHGADGAMVTATPAVGYHFDSWSDGYPTAARTDLGVTANISVTASFAINQYTLTYLAGANGSIVGPTPQTVNHGADGTLVTATPDPGYHFLAWSDGYPTAARTDLGVTGNITATATFSINQYTLTYLAGANGSIVGPTPQTVNHGADGAMVTATPAVGYHFDSWSDGYPTAARTDLGVTANISVTASFAINQYTLTYLAGANGSIVGPTPQTVNHGANGAPVTATPAVGYHFDSWSDGYPTAARTDLGVTGNITATATFALNTYTLTYTAGPNGSIVGPTPQTVNHGADGALVTATPAAGYHFLAWSDGYPTAARTDLAVTANITAIATFAINQYTLTYNAGPNGSIVGTTPQTVNHGADGTLVTATPAVGYHFDSWSDGYLTAARTDLGVTANITVTANFAINTYTLTYTAGANGSIVGTTPQTVNHGANGALVTATPNAGYHFVSWSDGYPTAARTDLSVTANISASASFAKNTIVVSQVYGGGGNTGATYTNDFIELFNRGADPIDVTGWSVQYASAAGSTWAGTPLSGVILPGHYYLVQEAPGAGGTTPLPTPDASNGTAMNSSTGKVALVNNSTALTGTCPTGSSIEDFVGYGTTANCSETSVAPTLSNTTADLRLSGGCQDTDNNTADFATGAPTPRNSASPLNNCLVTLVVSVDPPGSGSVNVSPLQVSYVNGTPVTLTATAVSGYHFSHWTGSLTGGANPSVLTMSGNKSVVAHFQSNTLASQMVISQVYGGGGNAGSTYMFDYVELYNRGNDAQDVTGWTVQYASNAGGPWFSTVLIGTVMPGQYYLVKEAQGAGGTLDLPTADGIGSIGLSATDGKVALASGNPVLVGDCPSDPAIVDFLGYGPANCFETAPSGLASNTLASFRGHGGCDETNNNSADFATGAPAPRNTASPFNHCSMWLGVDPGAVTEFALSSPAPNPTRSGSRIPFALPVESHVRLSVVDVQGRMIARLVDGVLPAGRHEVMWSGATDAGQVRPGIYFVRLEVPGQRMVRTVVLMR